MNSKNIITPIVLAGLGCAFIVVSLWLWLSKGKSAKATRAKLRVGAMILTLTSFVTATSCSTSCYDPAVPEPMVSVVSVKKDLITLNIENDSYHSIYSFRIFDKYGAILQEGILQPVNNSSNEFSTELNLGDYNKEFTINVYREYDESLIEYTRLLFTQKITL